MIFRWLYRRNIRRRWRPLLPADSVAAMEATADSMSEWRAFRHLFFPMSVLREANPQDLRQLQRMIEKAVVETEERKHE
jgi:hypothetical protein